MNTSKGDLICPNKVLTLVYVLEDEKVLLGMKKRGFGEGKVGNEKLNIKHKYLYALWIEMGEFQK